MLRRFVPLLPLMLTSSFAQNEPVAYFSVPPVDSPELAARGPHAVGVRTVAIVHPGQVDILKFDAATGKAPTYDRPLILEIWYPATIPAGAREHTVYESVLPGRGGAQLPNGPKP